MNVCPRCGEPVFFAQLLTGEKAWVGHITARTTCKETK